MIRGTSVADSQYSFSEFLMPQNRSFDVFLLEKGSELQLITQEFMRPQPSFTVTHGTQIFMSMSISKTSNKTCHNITSSEQMDCIIDKLYKRIQENNVSCLPPQVFYLLNELDSEFTLCDNGTESAMSALMVV